MRAPTIFDKGVSPDHLGRCSLPSSATGTAASDARQRTRRLVEASRSFGKAAAGARAHRAITLTVTHSHYERALLFHFFGEMPWPKSPRYPLRSASILLYITTCTSIWVRNLSLDLGRWTVIDLVQDFIIDSWTIHNWLNAFWLAIILFSSCRDSAYL